MLEDLGNLGDFLGSIGVVVTLLYLAAQIRQNTRQLKLDAESAKTIAFEETNSDISRWIQEIVCNRDVAELWNRGLKDLDQLDETDRLRFNYLGMQLLQAWQIVYQRSSQVENQELWTTTILYFNMYSRSPGFRTLWETSKGLLLQDYVAAVESQRKEFETKI